MTAQYSGCWALLAAVSALLPATRTASAQAGDQYRPSIPTKWAAEVTNPYFPLPKGTTWRFSGKTRHGLETGTVEVLPKARMVNGVAATAVRDRVYLDGKLIEETEDWYAQAADGSVWYLGEDSREIEDGRVVSREGSWEWTVKGALPGIIMWGDPASHVGEKYRQEYLKGEAEDFGTVVSVGQEVTVPNGKYTGCITTNDGSNLEPSVIETKTYCPRVGFVLETVPGHERIELISVTTP